MTTADRWWIIIPHDRNVVEWANSLDESRWLPAYDRAPTATEIIQSYLAHHPHVRG